ncbi:autoinducer binding domain-containing protein [Loktanella sp. IMCC34160]|uniref:autoinducer binding domain-containing protein n=1 Tax=Loktanella sp. IMCC34160 TaxID=2510646 RepID=UPI001A91538F|nr:autoinducer binding domain-containing protein [Loktanella sp. IMCC34160]
MQDIAPAGFAIAFHIQFTTPAFLFQTYPKEWINLYNKRGMVMQDPIVGFGFENNGTIRWSELAANDPAEVLSEASKYGLVYGMACGIEDGGSRSVAGFARSDRELTDAEIDQLQGLVQDLHTMTAEAKSVSPEVREDLRRMSISFTHP